MLRHLMRSWQRIFFHLLFKNNLLQVCDHNYILNYFFCLCFLHFQTVFHMAQGLQYPTSLGVQPLSTSPGTIANLIGQNRVRQRPMWDYVFLGDWLLIDVNYPTKLVKMKSIYMAEFVDKDKVKPEFGLGVCEFSMHDLARSGGLSKPTRYG